MPLEDNCMRSFLVKISNKVELHRKVELIKIIGNTGTPPITLFFGPRKIYHVIGKTVLKED